MRLTLYVDQDVGRLEIAVNNQMRVRVCDGSRHLYAELTWARTDSCVPQRCVRIDRLAIDIFQRQERTAVGGDTRIVESSDVRMRQRREDLAFARHPLGERCDSPAHVRQLQRDLAFQQAVGSIGQPDTGHAAVANFAQ